MATPMAMTVEYWGSAKTGFKGLVSSRSMELEATPPEKTTSRPGYCFWALRVAVMTAFATHRRA